MHTCCNLGPAPSKSILSVDEREKDVVVARDHREFDGNFDKDHRTNPSNLSFIRETIPLVARLPGWPNYDCEKKAPFPIHQKKKARSSRAHNACRRWFFPFGSFSLFSQLFFLIFFPFFGRIGSRGNRKDKSREKLISFCWLAAAFCSSRRVAQGRVWRAFGL